MVTKKRRMPTRLWAEIRELASGGETEKLQAVELLLSRDYRFPDGAVELLVSLSSQDQPEPVRIRLASAVGAGQLPYGAHLKIASALAGDPSEEVQRHLQAWGEVERRLLDSLEATMAVYSQSLSQAAAAMSRLRAVHLESPDARLLSMGGQAFIEAQERLTQQLGVLRELKLDMPLVGKKLLPLIEAGRQAQRLVSSVGALPTLSFYLPSELDEVETPPKEPPSEKGKELASRLRGTPPGPPGWIAYQDVCEEILNYCLSPPLMPALRQSPTSGGLQVRDLILHIPLDEAGYWSALAARFGLMAVIVECKNYTYQLRPNQVVISGKYLGMRRLGTVGLLLSRKGLGPGAMGEQTRIWLEESKLILSLTDEHLLKMIELKDRGGEPTMVVDAEIRRFLQELE